MVAMDSASSENAVTWNQAEAKCQSYGSNVHLAGMETEQVFIVQAQDHALCVNVVP